MKIQLSSSEKTVALVILFSFVATYNTVVFTAQYGSTPLMQLATQNPLVVGEKEITLGGDFRYQLISNNVSVGTFVLNKDIPIGKQLTIINKMDSVNIPYLYPPRTWTDFYIDNELVVDNSNNFLSVFAGSLWGIPAIILVGTKIKDKRKGDTEF